MDAKKWLIVASLPLLWSNLSAAAGLECTGWQQAHPEWIWCDDFESDAALESNYFEVDRASGRFGVSGEQTYGGTGALRGVYAPGIDNAGNVKLGVGRSPVASNIGGNQDYSELYWRFFMRMGPNWSGNAQKTTRGMIFSASNWSQAAIGHLWEDTNLGLGLDPVTGVVGNQVVTSGYNDFSNLRWLGKGDGTTQVYSTQNRNRWFCIEVRMKLNTPGQSDGVFAFWIDDQLEAERSGLDFRGGYTAYGINAIILENYVNAGFGQSQTRYMDNFVVSRQRIGCTANASPVPNPPTNLRAQ